MVLCFVCGSQNPGRDICPGSVVQGLLLQQNKQRSKTDVLKRAYLTPQNICIRILIKVGGDLCCGVSERNEDELLRDGPNRRGKVRFVRLG